MMDTPADEKGDIQVKQPISMEDLCFGYFALVSPAGAPRPKNYCPEDLHGYWHCIGEMTDGKTSRVPAQDRTWHLLPDSKLETRGDPDKVGAIWCVHLTARERLLWLFVKNSPAVKAFRIGFEGDTLFLVDSTDSRRVTAAIGAPSISSRFSRHPPRKAGMLP